MSNIYISTIKLGLCDQKKEKPLIKSYVKILVKSMTERDLFLHISIYSTSKTVYSKEKKIIRPSFLWFLLKQTILLLHLAVASLRFHLISDMQ